ncbi:MAG: type II toxin-antitoxin system Phd/YefM family antitoxin [Thermomicrobiales bacterium]
MATETIHEHIPVAKVRDDLDAIIDHAQETKQPIVVMRNGNAAVVIVDAAQYQQERESVAYLHAILQGLLSEGGIRHEEVEARLDSLLAE